MGRRSVLLLLVCLLLLSASAVRALPPDARQRLVGKHVTVTTFGTAAGAKRSLVADAALGLQWSVFAKCAVTNADIAALHATLEELSALFADLTASGVNVATEVPEAVPCALTLVSQSSRRSIFLVRCAVNDTSFGDRLAAVLANPDRAVLPPACYPNTTAGASRITVALDHLVRVNATQVTKKRVTNESVSSLWHLDRLDQRQLPLNGVYSYARDGSGVIVYVIDTGVRATHADFTGRAINGGNYVGDGIDDADCNGHGTHVTSLAGGAAYGVAKDAVLVMFKVLGCDGSGTFSAVSMALSEIEDRLIACPHDAVVSMSLAGSYYQPINDQITDLVTTYGLPVVVAAGNSGGNAASFSPASASGALAVGASDRYDNKASYSNDGTPVRVFAPGSSIIGASNLNDVDSTSKSGTSMATPIAAGVIALDLQQQHVDDPELAIADGRQAIADTLAMATRNKIDNPLDGYPAKPLLFSSFGKAAVPQPASPPPPPPPQPNSALPPHGTLPTRRASSGAVPHVFAAFLASPLAIALIFALVCLM